MAEGSAEDASAGTILQGGRAKAYRPMPAADRAAAFAAGLAAYDRGDFFLAHELLEPAWMGTDDLAERELYQGLIKLAAAFVHGVRGNPPGIATQPRGRRGRGSPARRGRRRRRRASTSTTSSRAIDDRLARLASDPDASPIEPPTLRRTPDDDAARRDPRDRRRRGRRPGSRRADAAEPLLVDVREPDEFRTVRANGAVLMPMSEFQERHAELPKDRPLLVICAERQPLRGRDRVPAPQRLDGRRERRRRHRARGSGTGCRSTAASRSAARAISG